MALFLFAVCKLLFAKALKAKIQKSNRINNPKKIIRKEFINIGEK
jgi:hypothetical protein